MTAPRYRLPHSAVLNGSRAEIKARMRELRSAITDAHDAGQYERRNTLCHQHDDLALALFNPTPTPTGGP